ncbi:replicative DNA helicase [Kiritimatiellota bacterium B12222]|nr:replicative DNA helicase [Kiritimatiellota bacterium B12222]
METPPHDEGAERGLIGCAITNPDVVVDLAVERGIRVDSFYLPAHQKLWETLVEMQTANKLIDGVMLSNRLREKQLFEEVGGLTYLQAVMDAAPISVHAESYVQVVREKSLMREVIKCAREAVDKCYDPDKDVELLVTETQSAFFSLLGGSSVVWHPWGELIGTAINDLNEIADNQNKMIGVGSGYRDIDKMLHGLKPTEMIVLAARPSMGKTSLALNIAENVAMGAGDPEKRQRGVAVFSLEMSAGSLVQRMICCRARVSMGKVMSGTLPAELHSRLMNAGEELKTAPIYIDDSGGLDVLEMRARARRLKAKHDLAFIVVDYLQIAHCAKQSKDGWQREVAGISMELKSMAKELNVPVMVLSQLSRDAEKRDRTSGVPKLSDLRDSGAIEQDADVVMLLRRPARYPGDPRAQEPNLAIVDIAKNRNGAVGEVELSFFEETTRFENRERQDMDSPL